MDKKKILRYALLVIALIAAAKSGDAYLKLVQLARYVSENPYTLCKVGGVENALCYSTAVYKPVASELNRQQVLWSLLFFPTWFAYARFDLVVRWWEWKGGENGKMEPGQTPRLTGKIRV